MSPSCSVKRCSVFQSSKSLTKNEIYTPDKTSDTRRVWCHLPSISTWWQRPRCEQLAHGCYVTVERSAVNQTWYRDVCFVSFELLVTDRCHCCDVSVPTFLRHLTEVDSPADVRFYCHSYLLTGIYYTYTTLTYLWHLGTFRLWPCSIKVVLQVTSAMHNLWCTKLKLNCAILFLIFRLRKIYRFTYQ